MYAGIEKLVWQYASELSKNHQVSVIARSDSVFPSNVEVFGYQPQPDEDTNIPSELAAYQLYQSKIRQFDVIHDFSHQHLASRFYANLPSLNIFWHAPALAQYPKAPYNIIALSQWAAREFKRVYGHPAKFQQSIVIDPAVYILSQRHRNDRFYSLGRMGAEKGNLEAAYLCKKAGVPLDIQGARGLENAPDSPLTDYEKKVLDFCDGEQIKYLGDLPEEKKIQMMQTNKALIYATNHPEVTSHKIQECLFCGMPVIVPNLGAIPEIVTHGINGYLCSTEQEYSEAIQNVDKLEPMKLHAEVVRKYSLGNVVNDYIPLYEQVMKGLRW